MGGIYVSETFLVLNRFFNLLSCVYQVNLEDRFSAFPFYQAKRLFYPYEYQSYRIMRESCSYVRVFYRNVR